MSVEIEKIKEARESFLQRVAEFKKSALAMLRYDEITGSYTNKEAVIDRNKETLVIVTAGSGTGKDSVLDKTCNLLGTKRITTSTSRARRVNENEPEDAYEWLRLEDYGLRQEDLNVTGSKRVLLQNKLKKRYGFIEADIHNGVLYGTRKKNLEKALGKTPAFMRVDINGVEAFKKLHEKRELGDINLVVICLVPDDLPKTAEIIASRGNVEKRFIEAVETLEKAKELANYFIVNKFNRKPEKGATYTAAGIIGLLRTIHVVVT